MVVPPHASWPTKIDDPRWVSGEVGEKARGDDGEKINTNLDRKDSKIQIGKRYLKQIQIKKNSGRPRVCLCASFSFLPDATFGRWLVLADVPSYNLAPHGDGGAPAASQRLPDQEKTAIRAQAQRAWRACARLVGRGLHNELLALPPPSSRKNDAAPRRSGSRGCSLG
jgi:hypothetical protein